GAATEHTGGSTIRDFAVAVAVAVTIAVAAGRLPGRRARVLRRRISALARVLARVGRAGTARGVLYPSASTCGRGEHTEARANAPCETPSERTGRGTQTHAS